MITLLAALVLQSSSLQWHEEATRLGVLSTAVESCHHYGYTSNPELGLLTAERAAQRRVDEGGDEGMVGSTGEFFIQTEIDIATAKSENIRQNRTRAAAIEFLDFWEKRCADASRWYPEVIIADGDEATVTARWREEVLSNF